MVEFERALSPGEVLAVDGGLVDRPPLDGDLAVGAVDPHHAHLGGDAGLLHQDTALLELQEAGFWNVHGFAV